MRKATAVLLVVMAVGLAQGRGSEAGEAAGTSGGEAVSSQPGETAEPQPAEGSGQQEQPAMCGGGGIMGILPIVAMVAIFYFLIIRPQQKQQKRLQQMRESLTKGDRVVTSGGIHGVVTNIKGSVLTIRISDGVKVDVEKDSVTVKQGEEGE
ncbi:MAG: preprotein translocase subunit YajC [Candidatus Fermentibacteraceae bacterium]